MNKGARLVMRLAIFVATAACSVPTGAERWTQLQFRQPLPIAYLVDIDGLRVDGAWRSLPAKWVLAPDTYQLGSWQFDCRARAWRAGGGFTIFRAGGVSRAISLPEIWRAAKPGSSIGQLMTLVCLAPSAATHDWLAVQLETARL